jgi:2-polyprenyl-3-methyl-5-hydroxy-6-metoxy-1,4-benzoquinol methylase
MPDREESAFEEIYARAGEDLASIPWADLTANPALTAWLDERPEPDGLSGLVVACGLGDDAEELARRGYRVTAFDVSPTAIERCRQRFPASRVEYVVADVFDLPSAWAASFDLVVEIRTLQSLPLDRRQPAARAIAAIVAPGGVVFVRTAARERRDPLGARPWPLTREELEAFERAGLSELSFRDEPPGPGRRFRTFTAVYQRPG